MSAGVGLFGVFSGFVASWFIGEEEQADTQELVEIRNELARFRELMERRS
jgi:voltage-gated potassium channel